MIGTVQLEPGTLVDGWQVVGPIGEGGFGAVYHVEKNGQPFALKFALHREASGDPGKTHARTLQELAILLLLRGHPNIIQPRAYGQWQDAIHGNVYLVLEYVPGWTLDQWKERAFPTAQEIARVGAKLAGACAAMHAMGVKHRDLKLRNVVIRKSDGEPILIDFGAATYERTKELTDVGLPPGTDRYRAPEAWRFLRRLGRFGKGRYSFQVADELFALGVMLYELLTDPRPMEDKNRPALNDPAPRGSLMESGPGHRSSHRRAWPPLQPFPSLAPRFHPRPTLLRPRLPPRKRQMPTSPLQPLHRRKVPP